MFLVLIAVVIVLIVPIVSAEKVPSVSSAKAASVRQSPQLKFNYFQEKVVVTGELSPGKNILTTPSALKITPRNKKVVTVPVGSIIYHKNNITDIRQKNHQT